MKSITVDFDASFASFSAFPQDKEMIKGILSTADEKEKPTVFFSLTHLMHNYITLTHIFNLAKLSKMGFEIVIALWDLNILSNPYFKKVEFERYRDMSSEQYLKQKKDEILQLTSALGIKDIKIYNSSELWARFIRQKEPALFTKYYSTLTIIDLDEYNINEKLNYLIQLPADVFFASFFNVLYPEDAKKPIDILYTSPNRQNLYFATRNAMYNEGITSMERPAIILSKEIPRIEIDTQIPHWGMSQSEISQLLSKWQFSHEEIKNLYQNVLAQLLPELTIISNNTQRTVSVQTAINEINSESRENIIASTAKNLFAYFQKAKEITKIKEAPQPEFFNIKNKKEASQIGAILKSKNMMKILVLSTGTRTISEISKAINLQLANTSQYIAKLKKAGLVSIKDKKVSRTAKGIKINFDASLES